MEFLELKNAKSKFKIYCWTSLVVQWLSLPANIGDPGAVYESLSCSIHHQHLILSVFKMLAILVGVF